MGVAGAAYATILAQCTSAVICFVKVRQVREEIGLSLMKWKPEVHYIQLVVKTGFPAAFQSCMIALGGMSVQRLVNSFGSSTMAAYVAANRVDSVAIQVIVSVGTALSVFTGQNIAKNQYDRIREALYKTLAVMVGASVCIATLVLIFRVQLMSLFLDAGESAESHRHRLHLSDHYRRGLCDRGGDAELPECDPGSRRRQYLYGSGTDGAVRQDRVRVSIVRNPGRHGNLDRHSSVLELWLCDSGDPVLFRQMEAQEAGLMTGVAGTQRGYSGRIHPAKFQNGLVLSLFLALLHLLAVFSGRHLHKFDKVAVETGHGMEPHHLGNVQNRVFRTA